MAEVGDLIDFNVIETQKENIQSMPGGRSAKSLSLLCSPLSAKGTSLSETQDLKNSFRQEYEKELQNIAEADDPLDVYDRYIKWTCDAYPTAQATAQSNLLPLLECATKAFVSSQQYKNDVRYLKIWLLYIKLFADTPRETYAFLARHNIGENLALFYEEFAAWLEAAGRWAQAEEVYSTGIDKEARPAERLIRKYAEFQHRRDTKGANEGDGPASPAMPRMRPALAAKTDLFAASSSPDAFDPQARDRAAAAAPKKSAKAKMAIFSDGGDAPAPAVLGNEGGAKGWDTIGSLNERKKENKAEARPWAGEKLDGGKKFGGPKMTIFKDEKSIMNHDNENPALRRSHLPKQTLNEKTGRMECVFVDLESVYPTGDDKSGVEFCFEELRARHRGWLEKDWTKLRRTTVQSGRIAQVHEQEAAPSNSPLAAQEREAGPPAEELIAIAETLERSPEVEESPAVEQPKVQVIRLNDDPDEVSRREEGAAKAARKARREERAANRTRKLQLLEIKAQPQTVQANLDSPTSTTKLKRRKMPEPTMTFHTKEAMNEVYDIFNQEVPPDEKEASEPGSDEEESDDDDYTSNGESTGTGRFSTATSEAEDDDDDDEEDAEDVEYTEKTTLDPTVGSLTNVSGYSEFTEVAPRHNENVEDYEDDGQTEDLATPTSPRGPIMVHAQDQDENQVEQHAQLPYRGYAAKGSSKLPFMTPIVEKTESSLGALTAVAERQTQYTKTPSRQNHFPKVDENGNWSSPFEEMTAELDQENLDMPPKQLNLGTAARPALAPTKANALQPKATPLNKVLLKGPIIKDAQCNPIDDAIKATILENIQPPLSTYAGFFDRRGRASGQGAEIRKYVKNLSKNGKGDKTASSISQQPPRLHLQGASRSHTVKRELGRGAFAPVYLLDVDQDNMNDEENVPAQAGRADFSSRTGTQEAMKMEEPPSAWEFYMLRQAKQRLSGSSRPAESIINAYEMHLFSDECFLIEEYRSQGTLLDVINIARAETGGGMDELLAMFFTVELFRTVEALHSHSLIHGDLKADNVLLRLDTTHTETAWSSQYQPSGKDGWSQKGISLIDFGRGIDMTCFSADVQFIADWKTSESDCPEMRELRPWTYQVDYHGLAGIVHSMLFGKYLETTAERGTTLGAGSTKTYKIKETLKRYWQTELWGEVFALLLNPLQYLEAEADKKMPVVCGLRDLRVKMETYIETNCEKGVGLKSSIRRIETMIKERRK